MSGAFGRLSTARSNSCYALTVEHISIRSSWIVGYGDVISVDGRRTNGKRLKPRKKRGKPISDAARQDQLNKIANARDRRRGGFDNTGKRS